MVEYTGEELRIIHEVFHALVHDSLEQWAQLITNDGEPFNGMRNKIWRMASEYNEIRHKAAVALGLEDEVTGEEYNFPQKT